MFICMAKYGKKILPHLFKNTTASQISKFLAKQANIGNFALQNCL